MSDPRLLELLVEAGPNWVSGEEISRRLGVTRTAVWKQIESLRAAGYLLEAQTRRGYRLVGSPDLVTPAEVARGLCTARMGRQIEYRETVGSTNDLARHLARAGAPDGQVVIADEQTAGKGRLGRSWTTPRGSALAMTLVLRPALPPHHAPRITLAAAVAVAEAVRSETGLPAGIKWPNDLQVRGRKFCGILTEMEADMDRVEFVVCGMGLNVNLTREDLPAEVQETATSLAAEAQRTIARAPLARAILTRFEAVYADLTGGCFSAVLERWRELSVTLGRQVSVRSVTGAPTLHGMAEDLDSDGALLVRSEEGGLHRVVAGEVSLREAP